MHLMQHNGQSLLTYYFISVPFFSESIHDTSQYANNRAELSHEPTRVRERSMRKFESMKQAQRFLGTHAAVYNLFNPGRHLVSAENYRYFRTRAFATWEKVVTA